MTPQKSLDKKIYGLHELSLLPTNNTQFIEQSTHWSLNDENGTQQMHFRPCWCSSPTWLFAVYYLPMKNTCKGEKKPGDICQAFCGITLPCFFLWISFLLCWAFLFSRLILLWFSCLFWHTIKFILVNYLLMAAAYFFPFFQLSFPNRATVQPKYN